MHTHIHTRHTNKENTQDTSTNGTVKSTFPDPFLPSPPPAPPLSLSPLFRLSLGFGMQAAVCGCEDEVIAQLEPETICLVLSNTGKQSERQNTCCVTRPQDANAS